jgi:hypothetical protein
MNTSSDPDILLLERTTRLAVQQFACPPQAARRNVQLGSMAKAVENLDRGVANLDELVAAGKFAPDVADQIREVHALLHAGIDASSDFFETAGSEKREFLYGDALETPDWKQLRYTARRCFLQIAGEESVFVALNAR